MTDLTSDNPWKQTFKGENNIAKLWLPVKNDFLTLTKKASKISLPLVKSYLCETDFTAVIVLVDLA